MFRIGRILPMSVMSLLTVVPSFSFAADEPEDAAPNRFVLRISREFLRRHLSPSIEETKPVNRMLFGAHVTGRTVTTGTTNIVMDLSEKDAKFVIRFTGSSVSTTAASKRPVVVHSTSTTNFVAERVVNFDGIRFSEEPATIESSTRSVTNCIAVPCGLIGRIVRNRAIPQIEANRAEGNAIANADTKKIVMDRFDVESARFTTEMNGIVPIQKTVALLIPKVQGWVNHLGSTKEFLYVSPGPVDNTIPILPKEYGRMKAPIELWIRGKARGDAARGALQTWDIVNRGLDRFRPKSAPAEKKKDVEGISVTAIGEWWVVKVGEDLADGLFEPKDEK